jgi:hypothetical protein
MSRARIFGNGDNMMKSIGAVSATALFFLLGFAPMVNARQDKPEDKPNPAKQAEPAKPEKQQQAKAPKQEPQAKPEKQQQAKAPKQEPQAKPEKQQQAKAPKQEPQAKPEKQQQAKAPKQEPQAKPEKQQQAKAPKQEPQAKPEKQQQAKGQQEQQPKQQDHEKSTKQQTAHTQQVRATQSDHNQTASSKGPQRTQEEMTTQQAQPALRLSARGSGRIPDDRFHSNFGREHEFRMGNPVMVSGYSRFQYGGYWFGYVQPWPVGWYYTDQFYIDYVDGGYYMYDPYYPGSRFAITVVI